MRKSVATSVTQFVLAGLAAVVLIHIIGALRHHLLKRNDVLRRMTWGMRG